MLLLTLTIQDQDDRGLYLTIAIASNIDQILASKHQTFAYHLWAKWNGDQ